MNLNLKAPVSTLVAVFAGLVVLLGYFLPLETVPFLGSLRTSLLQIAILLAGVALLMGMFNLTAVHYKKIREGNRNSLYSFFLLISMLVAFLITVLSTPQGEVATWFFTYINVPLEASLMAVLAIALAYATVRLLSHRLNTFTAVFVFTALLVLLGSGPFFGLEIPFLSAVVLPYVNNVLVAAGARGILLGVGLGVVATGLRVLFGADRPFGG